jgi:hypothetical protein
VAAAGVEGILDVEAEHDGIAAAALERQLRAVDVFFFFPPNVLFS